LWTRAEKVAWLEQVLEGLREEVQAVEERIEALKGEE
jgi:16S rRNA G527 N7-methylase RsmG